MNHIAENIKNRLSLREPLKEALDILVQLSDVLELKKEVDLKTELEKVRALYPTCTDFERDFVSFSFSIATGVGKTRLMGACVAYLYLQHGIRNFFILAPGTTIYNKLIEDFGTITNPKYVFKGIAEFVNNQPVIINGDNYNQQGNLYSDSEIRINVFNIAKFNREIKPSKEGGKNRMPRIKRLSEYLGQSYWEYLSNLKDLVILMDESHRYHADKSKEAINELKPILGIELSATTFYTKDNKNSESLEKIAFKNVVYEYSLAKALREGIYVKKPAIATRKDFSTQGKTEEDIERIKLEDAVNVHNKTKIALEQFAKENDEKLVKPFILVVCKDIAHAKNVFEYCNSKEFFDGAFNNRVLQIDSSNKDDDHIAPQFMALEHPENNIEIVIHVSMLKEGWDVSNLYTIVPLRTASSIVLIEQTIGRGLRLPFNGKRTGNDEVDKLTVLAHDNFDRIIQEASKADSVFFKINTIQIDEQQRIERSEVITVKSTQATVLEVKQKIVDGIADPEKKQTEQKRLQGEIMLFDAIQKSNTNPDVKQLSDLNKPEIKEQILQSVKSELNKGQTGAFDTFVVEELATNYTKLVQEFKEKTIEIPRMVLREQLGEAHFTDFDLNLQGFSSFRQLDDQIIRRDITDGKTDTIDVSSRAVLKDPLKLVITELIDYPEIDYDANADLLYKLSEQAVNEIYTHLEAGEDIRKIVFDSRTKIKQEIRQQMMVHFVVAPTEYQMSDITPFTRIEPWHFKNLINQARKEFTDLTIEDSEVKKYIFKGFVKSCHAEYRFDSSSELKFSNVLETDPKVIKWLRPAPNQFLIYWSISNKYEPDFVVETTDTIYLAEVKRADQLESDEVKKKTEAGVKYCKAATEFTAQHGGKPWKYVLFPHDAIKSNSSFGALTSGNVKN